MTDDDEPLYLDLESYLAAMPWDEATKRKVREDMKRTAVDDDPVEPDLPRTLH